MVTPALFRRYPDARPRWRGAAPEELEGIIRSTGFFRAKTKSLHRLRPRARRASTAARCPRELAELVKLPGVGRKTANVVLGHAYDIAEGIAVDTHVLRVSNRLGIAKGDDPVEVEQQLMAIVPRERWTRTTDLLIFHGRKICDARRPRCGECPVFALCRWPYRQAYAMGAPPPAGEGRGDGEAPRRCASGPRVTAAGRRGPDDARPRTSSEPRHRRAPGRARRPRAARASWRCPRTSRSCAARASPCPRPQALDGPWVARMAALARRHRAHRCCSAACPSGSRATRACYNTSVLLGPDGAHARGLPQDPPLRHRPARAWST